MFKNKIDENKKAIIELVARFGTELGVAVIVAALIVGPTKNYIFSRKGSTLTKIVKYVLVLFASFGIEASVCGSATEGIIANVDTAINIYNDGVDISNHFEEHATPSFKEFISDFMKYRAKEDEPNE